MSVEFFFINLDRDLARRERMFASARAMRVDFRRVSAVDMRNEKEIAGASADLRKFGNERWQLGLFEIAVFESHRRAWTSFQRSGSEFGVILEDDVLFSGAFIDAVMRITTNAPKFDIVRLNHSIQKRMLGTANQISNDLELRPILETIADAGCYLITQGAASSLLEQSRRYSSHLDDFVFSPKRQLRTYQLLPPVASQLIHRADLHTDVEINISSRLTDGGTHEKAPVFFRISREVRRLLQRATWRWIALVQGGRKVDLSGLLKDFEPIKIDH